MLCTRIIILAILAAGYHISEAIENDNKVLTFADRVTYLLKKKCLRTLDQIQYQQLLKQLDHLNNDCLNLVIGPEAISHQESASLCHEQANKFLQCLTTFAENVDPCLEPEEKVLKQFVLNIFNSSSEILCNQIESLNTEQLLKTNATKCLTTFKEHPDINPHIVCFENDTIIGDNPTEKHITKHKLCSNIIRTNFCYSDLLNEHCPDAPQVHQIQKGILLEAMQSCTSVLFRGTLGTTIAPEKTTPK